MKNLLRSLFAPVLNLFESEQGQYAYKKSHRTILIVVGLLFLLLAFGSLFVAIQAAEWGGLIPILGFGLVGSVCEIVGLLGSDQAVATLWKNK